MHKTDEKLFGQICLEKGWCTSEQLDQALIAQSKLEEINVKKRIGEILLAREFLTNNQLEEILKIQYYSVFTKDHDILGSLAVKNKLITPQQLKKATKYQHENHDQFYNKDSLGDVLVKLGYITNSTLQSLKKLQMQKEGQKRATAFCPHCKKVVNVKENYCIKCNNKIPPLASRGDTKIFRMVSEVKSDISERIPAFTKTREYSKNKKEELKPQKAKRSFKSLVFIFIASIVCFLLFAFGFFAGSNVSTSTTTLKSDSKSKEAIDLSKNIKNDTVSPLTVEDLLPLHDSSKFNFANILQYFGFSKVQNGTWVPNYVVQESKLWEQRKIDVKSQLMAFELDGKRFFAIVHKKNDGELVLELADGTFKNFENIEIIRQVRVFREYLKFLKEVSEDDRKAEFYLKIASFCEDNGWDIEARNMLIAGFSKFPKNSKIRKRLKVILPGEISSYADKGHIFENELEPMPIPPELPTIKKDLPLSIIKDPLPELDEINWQDLIIPIPMAEFFKNDPWKIDTERERMNSGESLYLGYWFKSNAIRYWKDAARAFKIQLVADDIYVATENTQFNREVLYSGKILFQLCKKYFTEQMNSMFSRKPRNWLDLPAKTIIFLKSPDVNELYYGWLKNKFNVIFVTIHDWRRITDLIFPFVKAFCKYFMKKVGISGATDWIQDGISSEFAYRFLSYKDIYYNKLFEICKSAEIWRRTAKTEVLDYAQSTQFDDFHVQTGNFKSLLAWGIVRSLLNSSLKREMFFASYSKKIAEKKTIFSMKFKQKIDDILASIKTDAMIIQEEIIAKFELNYIRTKFLTSAAANELYNRNQGVFQLLVQPETQEKYSVFELVGLISLSAHLDLLAFGSITEKATLLATLEKSFTDNKPFQTLLEKYK